MNPKQAFNTLVRDLTRGLFIYRNARAQVSNRPYMHKTMSTGQKVIEEAIWTYANSLHWINDNPKFVIIGTGLVEVLDYCTCGSNSNLYQHEQYCGYEPVVDLSTLEGFKELREANE